MIRIELVCAIDFQKILYFVDRIVDLGPKNFEEFTPFYAGKSIFTNVVNFGLKFTCEPLVMANSEYFRLNRAGCFNGIYNKFRHQERPPSVYRSIVQERGQPEPEAIAQYNWAVLHIN